VRRKRKSGLPFSLRERGLCGGLDTATMWDFQERSIAGLGKTQPLAGLSLLSDVPFRGIFFRGVVRSRASQLMPNSQTRSVRSHSVLKNRL
jgi:hypothetical protein